MQWWRGLATPTPSDTTDSSICWETDTGAKNDPQKKKRDCQSSMGVSQVSVMFRCYSLNLDFPTFI